MYSSSDRKSNFGYNIIEEAIYKRSFKILKNFNLWEKVNNWILTHSEINDISRGFVNFLEDFKSKTWHEFNYKAFIMQLSSLWEKKINQLLSELWVDMVNFEHTKVEYAVWRYASIWDYLYNQFKFDPIWDYLKSRKDRLRTELNLNIR